MNELKIEDYEVAYLIYGYHIPMEGIESIKTCPDKFKNLTPFTGNQHNEDWEWDRRAVSELSFNDKIELLEFVRDKIGYKPDIWR